MRSQTAEHHGGGIRRSLRGGLGRGARARWRAGAARGHTTIHGAGTIGGRLPAVDARTDIFALGRILRDLIPDPPPRPLAAIAQKASAEDAAARFGDVQQLAADVGRYLDGQPVAAYRDTVSERMARFCRQNQVLLLLLGTYFVVKLLLYFLAPALK